MLYAALLSALLMGLVGSTHCIGMCGGIVSTLNTDFSGRRNGGSWSIQLAYNAGRISSYMLIGLLAGLFTSQLMERLPDPHAVSMKISGLFFILLGIYISQLFNSLGWLEKAGAHLWRRIEPLGRRYLPARNPFIAWKLGLIWGWLPCGLVYSALALAITRTSAWEAALTMLAFGLGTLPTLLLIGHFSAQLRLWLQQKWLRWTLGGLLVIYGLMQIFGGAGMGMMAHQ
jgi:sulfite exporter TauE/SafE